MERTLVIVKPDGVQRGLVGEILNRYEDRGLRIAAAKFISVPPDLAQTHYAEHEDKPFYDDLVEFITSGPVLAAVIEGEDAISVVRTMHGATDPTEATPGTVRGDLGLDIQNNVVHGSDSAKSAEREIDLWFDTDEIVDYERHDEDWVYS